MEWNEKLLNEFKEHEYKYNIASHGNRFVSDYIAILVKLVNDKGNWIEWYAYENNFGEKQLKAYKSNDDMVGFKIKSAKDLWKLIKI